MHLVILLYVKCISVLMSFESLCFITLLVLPNWHMTSSDFGNKVTLICLAGMFLAQY